MMTNLTKMWLKSNLRDVTRLAETGVQVCKNILNARSQYNRTSDPRWLDNLTTNINTYQRWAVTVEGKAAIENLHKPKPNPERRGAQRNKTMRVSVSKPAARPTKQTRNQRTIR
jgi:hypothetical protein